MNKPIIHSQTCRILSLPIHDVWCKNTWKLINFVKLRQNIFSRDIFLNWFGLVLSKNLEWVADLTQTPLYTRKETKAGIFFSVTLDMTDICYSIQIFLLLHVYEGLTVWMGREVLYFCILLKFRTFFSILYTLAPILNSLYFGSILYFFGPLFYIFPIILFL